jgi:hypothetical protein
VERCINYQTQRRLIAATFPIQGRVSVNCSFQHSLVAQTFVAHPSLSSSVFITCLSSLPLWTPFSIRSAVYNALCACPSSVRRRLERLVRPIWSVRQTHKSTAPASLASGSASPLLPLLFASFFRRQSLPPRSLSGLEVSTPYRARLSFLPSSLRRAHT